MIAMKEELKQFERSEVWELIPRPPNQSVIGTRWVIRAQLVYQLIHVQLVLLD